jgi:PAS domain S-box-containing protein
MSERSADDELRSELARVQAAFHDFRWFLPDALVEGDLSTFRVTFLNRMAQILLGYTAEDVEAGLLGTQLFSPAELPRALALVQTYVGQSREEQTAYQPSSQQDLFEQELRRKDGTLFWAETQTSFALNADGVPQLMRTVIRDITARRKAEQDRQRTLIELQQALTSVSQLRSLLPVCSDCKRISDGADAWSEIEPFVRANAGIAFEETLCPDCEARRDPGRSRLAW